MVIYRRPRIPTMNILLKVLRISQTIQEISCKLLTYVLLNKYIMLEVPN